MKIYFVEGKIQWPVGNAGAVVIASTKQEAVNLAQNAGVYVTGDAYIIGTPLKKYKEPTVVFHNSTEY